jgi:alcohol dehydrogenase
MKALVYKSVGTVALQDHPVPKLQSPTDAIIRLTKSTICGTDLHIRKGDVATCSPGRVLGHEGVGVVHAAGSSVGRFKAGDHVLISCISSCATCEYCRRGMYSHCESGGWILGNTIDGTQAEYVRIPHADSSLYAVPPGVDEAALVMLSDIFPTGLECGVINGKVQPGSTVAIVGAGPVGLAALVTAQMYSPSKIFMVDVDVNRLKVSTEMGAHHTVVPGSAVEEITKLTDGKGCDAVIEAVGVPASFELCQKLLAPGGVLANVGVHGTKVDLHLEDLWARNISITTRLVDTVSTPMLLKLVESGRLQPKKLITHEFDFYDVEKAYATFGAAAEHSALKVLLKMGEGGAENA